MQPQRDGSMGAPQAKRHPSALDLRSRFVTLPPAPYGAGGVHGAAVNLIPSGRSVPNPDLPGGVCRCRVRSARANLALARSTPAPLGGGSIETSPVSYNALY